MSRALSGLPGWRVKSAGAYFAWVQHPLAESSASLARRMVADIGVLALPGTMFMPPDDPDGARHLRIAFANAALEAEDVEAWISAHGAIPAGACVAMHSGWGAKVATPAFRNTPDGAFAFPGFGKSATDLLATMDVAAIASDTLSLDPGNSADFAVHNSWLPGGRYGIENLAHVDQLPAKGATIFVGAPKHARGTGGPARVMALV